MKNFLSAFCSILLCLNLAACGGGESTAPFDPETDAQTLLDSGAFSDALTQLDQDVACALYGIDGSTVTSAAVYASSGASAEELALFAFSSDEDAEDALTALGYRVEDRKDELKDYLPKELTKLDKAVLTRRENSLLLVIAADYAPVDDFLSH